MNISLGISVGCADLSGSSRVEAVFLVFSTILFPTRSPIASTVFWVAVFGPVLTTMVADFFVVSKCLCPYLLVRFLTRNKNPEHLIQIRSQVQLKISLFTPAINN